jgi:hypothetical protein
VTLEEATRQLQLSRSVFYHLLRQLQTAATDIFPSSLEERARIQSPRSPPALLPAGMPPPHHRTIRNRVEALDLKTALQKREGAKKKAREQVEPVSISSLSTRSYGSPPDRSHSRGRNRGRSRATSSHWPTMAYTRNRCNHANGRGVSYLAVGSFHCFPMSYALSCSPAQKLVAGGQGAPESSRATTATA